MDSIEVKQKPFQHYILVNDKNEFLYYFDPKDLSKVTTKNIEDAYLQSDYDRIKNYKTEGFRIVKVTVETILNYSFEDVK
ncbi:MAG: hypothetical protein AABY32_01325 [Nanoarchaeota archaeon]